MKELEAREKAIDTVQPMIQSIRDALSAMTEDELGIAEYAALSNAKAKKAQKKENVPIQTTNNRWNELLPSRPEQPEAPKQSTVVDEL
ncbi:hypothetical protein WA556_002340, partial [Blastocystis sp. ATCC 50177/Nand II]